VVAASYHESPDQAHRWTVDGWFRTGDVATWTTKATSDRGPREGFGEVRRGMDQLCRPRKHFNGSSSRQGSLCGRIPHPKWQERPLAAVVLKDGRNATPQELRAFLAESFAKWQLPDAFVFLDAIPRTSVGKFKKLALREQFATGIGIPNAPPVTDWLGAARRAERIWLLSQPSASSSLLKPREPTACAAATTPASWEPNPSSR